MSPPLLELEGVTHHFGGAVALDQASLRVRAGTVHALLGENGAGKTTLMRVAFGAVVPDAGTIRIAGAPVRLLAPADAIARGIGMVHQHFTTIPSMTVVENVALGGRGRLQPAALRRRIDALSARSGLRIDPDAEVRSMSLAALQRLEILKALHRDARVLILDEPSAVLAPAEVTALLAWIRGWAQDDRAAVLITHKLHEALSIADEVTVLRRGRVVVSSPASAMTATRLAAAMLGTTADSVRDAPDGAAAIHGPVDHDRSDEAAEALAEDSPEDTKGPSHDRGVRSYSPARGAIVARLDGVAATFDGEVLHEATVEIRAGEIVGVAGIDGSGQRALLRVLAGRIAPRAGNCVVTGTVAFIPEDRERDAVAAGETLVANVALRGAGARRGAMKWRGWRARTRALVRDHGVQGVPAGREHRTPAAALSGGNQQKLVVARELEGDPALIVAEQWARGLDVHAAADVTARLRAAAAAGAAVVVHSADLDELLALCGRVLVAHGGVVHQCAHDRDVVGRAMLGMR